MRNSVLMASALCLSLVGATSAQEVLVTNDIAVSTTWTANNYYNLQGQIYVRPGATLTINAGVVIGSDAGGSLAVTRGGQINIQGTADNPVIMTAKSEFSSWTPLGSHPTGRDPKTGSWDDEACELWGNLTLMGNGYISSCVGSNSASPSASNVHPMEGLVEAFPGDPDVLYGGGNDDDDSGTISYLSIRYGGKVESLAKELNGLSLGGIGRETDIHHVEIMNNVDDGIEIWGGTVAIRNFAIWNVGDDSLDIDQGWRGTAQFGLIVQGYSCDASQGSGVGDNCIETDGAEGSDYQPVTTATMKNLTVIGQPFDGDGATAWRDNARIQYRNCIFMDCGEKVVRFDDDGDHTCGFTGYGANGTLSWADTWTTSAGVHSTVNAPANPGAFYAAQITPGNLIEMKDSVFYNNAATDAYAEADARGVFAGGNDNVKEPSGSPIVSITRGAPVIKGGKAMVPVLSLDPRPANDARSSASYCSWDGTTGLTPATFESAAYRGAFPTDGNLWTWGWTASEAYGMTPAEDFGDLGHSLEGLNGAPILHGSGTLGFATPLSLTVTNARPGTFGVMGFSIILRGDYPLFGGTLVPDIVSALGGTVPFATGGGTGGVNTTWPGGPPGFNVYFQAFIIDAAGPLGWSATNAIQGQTQ